MIPPPEFAHAPIPKAEKNDLLPGDQEEDGSSKTWVCGYQMEGGLCTRTFRSFKAVNQHRISAHGVRDPWMQIVTTNVCPYCLTEYVDISRAQRHVMDALCRGGACVTQTRYYGGRHDPDRRARHLCSVVGSTFEERQTHLQQ